MTHVFPVYSGALFKEFDTCEAKYGQQLSWPVIVGTVPSTKLFWGVTLPALEVYIYVVMNCMLHWAVILRLPVCQTDRHDQNYKLHRFAGGQKWKYAWYNELIPDNRGVDRTEVL